MKKTENVLNASREAALDLNTEETKYGHIMWPEFRTKP
jgi:hypothetical protein